MRSDELNYLAVTVGRTRVIPASLVNHAEPLMAIRHFGVALQQFARGPLSLIEPPGVHQIDHGIGGRIEHLRCLERFAGRLALCLLSRSPLGHGVRELCACGRLVLFQTALLVFLPAAAGARIVPARRVRHAWLFYQGTPSPDTA